MTWFRRGGHSEPASATAEPTAAGPEALVGEIFGLNRFINQNSGHLPAVAVVTARAVTDRLRQIVETSDDGPMDIQAVLFVEGAVRDYLPTTLRTYLAVDPSLANTPRSSGETPTGSLLGQLAVLRSSADATLTAAKEQDVDALVTQGNFLSTKFSRSDLDL